MHFCGRTGEPRELPATDQAIADHGPGTVPPQVSRAAAWPFLPAGACTAPVHSSARHVKELSHAR
jgi:hypothetical protein